MHRITPQRSWPLHGIEATRRLEAAAQAALPPHALMQRAGLAVAQLALAVAPHARTVWVACGPGNNGGDGLEAALHLRSWGKEVVVTHAAGPGSPPADAAASLARARDAGVRVADAPSEGLTAGDLGIDALLGLGSRRAPEGRLAHWIATLNASSAPVLAVDLPSGLHGDHGTHATDSIAEDGQSARADCFVRAQHTLSLLTLKPGLFTAGGRDAAGQIWFDDLGVPAPADATAHLLGPPADTGRALGLHASHKGSYGDVAVVGGAAGMAGAALLAAQAALHAGAGRVFVGLLDPAPLPADPSQPELMLRGWSTLPLASAAVVCGCGGGEAVREALPAVLHGAAQLVLDADALNALAADTALQALVRARARRQPHTTVITPHPLEAARLLGQGTTAVQADRLGAALALADRFQCTVVLKGSGSVIATPGETPAINPTGNARLATAGTGDVLAGLTGALLARGYRAHDAAGAAAYRHGQVADGWPRGRGLTASRLAQALGG
ncbi:MAG: NAD(P)H-hydrate dehydratase [Ramlibacter sp.]|nr:NAD(P)H-hydrate dehydratase [Ramlibacter sp.]